MKPEIIQNFELKVNPKGVPYIRFNNFYKEEDLHNQLLQIFINGVKETGLHLVEVDTVYSEKSHEAYKKYEIRIGAIPVRAYLEAKKVTPYQEGEEEILP